MKESDIVESAKAVVHDHELKTKAAVVDEILLNFADDVVLIAPGSHLVQGSESLRSFYGSLLDMGSWEFTHDYSGHDVEGDSVILHGIARGSLTAPSSEPVAFSNNFLLILRKDSSGFKIWRGAFAPSD